MKKPCILACFLLPLALGLALQEDDLVFDDVGEDSASTTPTVISRHFEERRAERRDQRWSERSRDGKKRHQVERLLGVPDVVVPVGHVLKLRIPRQAFAGTVDYYEVLDASGRSLPNWMEWDAPASIITGVPARKDIGTHHLSIKAVGKHGDSAKVLCVVQVVPEKQEELKHKDGKTHCSEGEEQTLLTILLGAKFEDLPAAVRVSAIENLAGFLGLHTSAISLHSYSSKDNANLDSAIILTGPGNVKQRKEEHLSAIHWQVGCDGHLWKHQTDLVKQLREQAKDGTLAEVLQLPVLSWHVRTDSSPLSRNRREVGSGDYGDVEDYGQYGEDYDDEDYEDGEEDDADNEDPQVQPTYVPDTNSPRGNTFPEHPHRHHHGEETINWNTEEVDEHDIIPVLKQNKAESAVNRTTVTVPITTTTTELTPRPSTTTTTTMPTTSTASTTSTTTTPIAATSIRTTSTTSTSTTADTTTTTTSTTTTTATASTTVVPPTESPKPETTEESTEKTRPVEIESITVLPTTPPEFTPTPPTITVPHSSTTGIPFSTTERPETETTVGSPNVTLEEPTEQSAMSSTRQPTTVPTTLTASMAYNTTTTVTTTSTTSTPPPSPTSASTTTPRITTTPQTYTTNATTVSTTTTTTTTTPATTTTTAPNTTTQAPRVTTESIVYEVNNFPPRQDRRLKKIPVTAGKPLSYVIPSNTFTDLEDGDTRKLKLTLYLQGVPPKPTHWLQFNQRTQEIYGLPLENDVSTWNYELVAADSEGLTVTDRLDIHVQQHKLSRSVNHEFSIYLKIDKRNEFPTDVDWELKVIRSLAQLYGDSDPRHITVRSIDIHTLDHDQVIFTWTNDSFPRSAECPKEYINNLLRVLVDKDGDPSSMLREVLAPEIRVKRVVYLGIGQCEEMNQPEPIVPKVFTQEPRTNVPPVPRNQVDHVNATVGQLLVFKVPEDTFFDSEDGSSRNMKMSLLTIERTPIPPHEWLQFDSKNQEFYGVPMRSDIGRKEYQLVVTDREGASATDGLVVVVHPAPPMKHTVEFSMTLDIPYESFAHSALQKRNFIEKLRDLYEDRDTSAISLHSISNGSTVITWHNRTLPTSYCAHEQVNRLRSVLVKSDNDRRSVTDEVLETMGVKFPVKQITVMPMGICLGELTGVHSPDNYVPPVDDSTSVGAFHDDYLITFVLPAIIIAAMLILAGIIACVLYKRRRSGKMSVSEQDDERQSFRSKGIPVIFQDELDEKPDPGNKSPVILKEEKPPLPPPEYQKAEDGADVPMLPKENSEEPYQPPPPFATNRDTNRQNRPKPTPTYRKPPPYVPP
ncbi:hypothetical protein KM043_010163 [Ampulex compressa]|nr:hypothetical protein KM043_010163 [Ampulex compressa]